MNPTGWMRKVLSWTQGKMLRRVILPATLVLAVLLPACSGDAHKHELITSSPSVVRDDPGPGVTHYDRAQQEAFLGQYK